MRKGQVVENERGGIAGPWRLGDDMDYALIDKGSHEVASSDLYFKIIILAAKQRRDYSWVRIKAQNPIRSLLQ